MHRMKQLSRRDALQVGGLGPLGVGLSQWLSSRSAQAGEASTVRAKNCVVIWLDGGPSHLETLDPKPDAPTEVRGPLDAISTSLASVTLSECLPETARRMNQVAIIRSMTSPLGEHNFGTHYLLSGYRPTPVLEYPAFSSAAALLTTETGTLPAHIAVPDYRVGGGRFSGNGFLPRRVAPFSLGSDPAKRDFAVRDLTAGLPLDRLGRRREFVQQLERFTRQLESGDVTPPGDQPGIEDPVLGQAWRLITSPEARQAFQLDEEPDKVRNRYGRRTVGQSCLLARRLIERGVPFVTVNHRGWDTHQDLTTRLKDGFTGAKNPVGLVPTLDLAFTALIDDLAERGLLDETLIVVMGEFGRTPKLNARAGRDHWPRVFSVALAGCGVRGGQVIGTSDATGESPADRPVTPSDLSATIYRLLGIDPGTSLQTPDGRPVRLTDAHSQVIGEIVS